MGGDIQANKKLMMIKYHKPSTNKLQPLFLPFLEYDNHHTIVLQMYDTNSLKKRGYFYE